jgi:hypothetical protein
MWSRFSPPFRCPSRGFGARLYQLAWAEKFEDAKVEARLRSLKAADLESTLFTRFDWVFYLPPRNALDRMLDDLIAAKLKEEKAGLMARMAVKSVMLIVKPKLRRAFEALRKGMLLETVADARTSFSQPELNKLMGAYIEALVPDKDDDDKHQPAVTAGSEHERAVRAVAAAAKLPPKVEEGTLNAGGTLNAERLIFNAEVRKGATKTYSPLLFQDILSSGLKVEGTQTWLRL